MPKVKMSADYKVRYVLICEDIRKEENGKLFIIGAYNDVIILSTVPTHFLSLCFKINIKLERNDFKVLNFIVRHQNGSEIINASNEPGPGSTKEPMDIILKLANPTLSAVGKYSILLRSEERRV